MDILKRLLGIDDSDYNLASKIMGLNEVPTYASREPAAVDLGSQSKIDQTPAAPISQTVSKTGKKEQPKKTSNTKETSKSLTSRDFANFPREAIAPEELVKIQQMMSALNLPGELNTSEELMQIKEKLKNAPQFKQPQDLTQTYEDFNKSLGPKGGYYGIRYQKKNLVDPTAELKKRRDDLEKAYLKMQESKAKALFGTYQTPLVKEATTSKTGEANKFNITIGDLSNMSRDKQQLQYQKLLTAFHGKPGESIKNASKSIESLRDAYFDFTSDNNTDTVTALFKAAKAAQGVGGGVLSNQDFNILFGSVDPSIKKSLERWFGKLVHGETLLPEERKELAENSLKHIAQNRDKLEGAYSHFINNVAPIGYGVSPEDARNFLRTEGLATLEWVDSFRKPKEQSKPVNTQTQNSPAKNTKEARKARMLKLLGE
jgi:hypothetical protein